MKLFLKIVIFDWCAEPLSTLISPCFVFNLYCCGHNAGQCFTCAGLQRWVNQWSSHFTSLNTSVSGKAREKWIRSVHKHSANFDPLGIFVVRCMDHLTDDCTFHLRSWLYEGTWKAIFCVNSAKGMRPFYFFVWKNPEINEAHILFKCIEDQEYNYSLSVFSYNSNASTQNIWKFKMLCQACSFVGDRHSNVLL